MVEILKVERKTGINRKTIFIFEIQAIVTVLEKIKMSVMYHNYNERGVSFDYGERNNVRCLCSQRQGQSRALLRAFQPIVFY